MQSFLLQNWVTVGTDSGVVKSVVQPAESWLDLGFASEVLFHLEVSRADSSGTQIVYETSPLRDGSLFRTLKTLTVVPSAAPVVTRVALYDDPTQPLSRWVRWRATRDTGAWAVTFRITVMAHAR